jgi:hypothetical protein
MPVVAMGANSNHACATCPTVATIQDVRVPVADVGASYNHTEARPLLLGHHSNDGTTATCHLTVATEGCRPLLQRHIIVVIYADRCILA